ncbi:hypothetical protein KAI87_16300 [Myxococcota bacterium]|nr:hypothetical protein [Myxococcota bacterium]
MRVGEVEPSKNLPGGLGMTFPVGSEVGIVLDPSFVVSPLAEKYDVSLKARREAEAFQDTVVQIPGDAPPAEDEADEFWGGGDDSDDIELGDLEMPEANSGSDPLGVGVTAEFPPMNIPSGGGFPVPGMPSPSKVPGGGGFPVPGMPSPSQVPGGGGFPVPGMPSPSQVPGGFPVPGMPSVAKHPQAPESEDSALTDPDSPLDPSTSSEKNGD